MRYVATVQVALKPGVLDPAGAAVESGLRALGFAAVGEVRFGKLIHLAIEAESPEAASLQVEEMACRLLANPVLETFTYAVAPAGGEG